jgi:hypothetical protein
MAASTNGAGQGGISQGGGEPNDASFLTRIAAAIDASLTTSGGEAGGGARTGSGSDVHGAPGPIAGAGLPVLAVGYGVYWLVRRRRRTAQ